MKLGIVGLPNVGKSTLFNAITSTKNAEAANYPFCTIEPNSGIVAVPDKQTICYILRIIFCKIGILSGIIIHSSEIRTDPEPFFTIFI